MGYYCTVPQCTSLAGKTRNVKFHRFPRDGVLADKWNDILKRGKPYTKYSKVCSLHFSEQDYSMTTMGKNKGQWKSLNKDAIPTRNLPICNADGSLVVMRKARTSKDRSETSTPRLINTEVVTIERASPRKNLINEGENLTPNTQYHDLSNSRKRNRSPDLELARNIRIKDEQLSNDAYAFPSCSQEPVMPQNLTTSTPLALKPEVKMHTPSHQVASPTRTIVNMQPRQIINQHIPNPIPIESPQKIQNTLNANSPLVMNLTSSAQQGMASPHIASAQQAMPLFNTNHHMPNPSQLMPNSPQYMSNSPQHLPNPPQYVPNALPNPPQLPMLSRQDLNENKDVQDATIQTDPLSPATSILEKHEYEREDNTNQEIPDQSTQSPLSARNSYSSAFESGSPANRSDDIYTDPIEEQFDERSDQEIEQTFNQINDQIHEQFDSIDKDIEQVNESEDCAEADPEVKQSERIDSIIHQHDNGNKIERVNGQTNEQIYRIMEQQSRIERMDRQAEETFEAERSIQQQIEQMERLEQQFELSRQTNSTGSQSQQCIENQPVKDPVYYDGIIQKIKDEPNLGLQNAQQLDCQQRMDVSDFYSKHINTVKVEPGTESVDRSSQPTCGYPYYNNEIIQAVGPGFHSYPSQQNEQQMNNMQSHPPAMPTYQQAQILSHSVNLLGPEQLIAKQNALAGLWTSTLKRPFLYGDSSQLNNIQNNMFTYNKYEDIVRSLNQ